MFYIFIIIPLILALYSFRFRKIWFTVNFIGWLLLLFIYRDFYSSNGDNYFILFLITLIPYIYNIFICYRIGKIVDNKRLLWLILSIIFNYLAFLVLFIRFAKKENLRTKEQQPSKEYKKHNKKSRLEIKQYEPSEIKCHKWNPNISIKIKRYESTQTKDIDVKLPPELTVILCKKCDGTGVNLRNGEICHCNNGFTLN
ncbi:MAG: hypothetical protein K8S23_10865 [Candidatus Cloacimonetes bacterium]|nr:hypothetical protein [Candidatus Cloacimonadota bacterium]